MDLNSILQNAQNPDWNIRSQAEGMLEDALKTQYGPFLVALVTELVNEQNPIGNRQMGGLYLKNVISALDISIVEEKEQRWKDCDPASKETFRAGLLQALISPVKEASHTSAQVIAAFGAVDLQMQEWPSLLTSLLEVVSSPAAPELAKVSALECLGYLCDSMDPDVEEGIDKGAVDLILNSIVNGMATTCTDDIRAAAVTAMANSLKFCTENFKVQAERDAIMQSVCEATQCSDPRVRMKAYQCMDEVAENFYEALPPYVEAMFGLTINAMTTDEEEVGKQAVEFWSTVCAQEQDQADLLQDEPDAQVTQHHIIEQAVPALMPIILNLLLRQPEDPSEENFSIQNNASVLLVMLAELLGDKILQNEHVIPFISGNIVSSEWRQKEAALTAFGSILDGPSSEECAKIIHPAIPMLIECFQHQHPAVRATAAFSLGRVCEFHSTTIPPEHLPTLMQALMGSLQDESTKVASQGIYSLYSLAFACADYSEAETNILSQYFSSLCTQLLGLTTHEDYDVDNLRSSAYETIMMVVENSALDMCTTVVELLVDALNRLESTFASQDDLQDRMQLQSCICGLLATCIQKVSKEELSPHADRIIALTLQVFTAQGALAHEDAFNMIGKFAEKVGEDFNRYIAHVAPCLVTGLKNMEEYAVCATAVCAIGDISRAISGTELLPYCDVIMESLLTLLQANELHRSVKPPILSAFADVAMCIGDGFEKYSEVTLSMLQQAGMVTAEDDDEDLIEYINSLREAILEAYTGILIGLADAGKVDVMVPFLDSVLDFMQRCVQDDNKTQEIVKTTIGLLGDMGRYFGNKMNPVYQRPFVQQLLQEGSQDAGIKDTTDYARGIVMACSRL